MRKILIALLTSAWVAGAAQTYDSPGMGNPLLPGYFADPTVKKFGDTWYLYATTDGSGAGFGPAQCWVSNDFEHWSLRPMNWPTSHWIWAPDVMRNPADGKYYYIYCQPCQIHVGVSGTPAGPWRNILGESEAVLIPDRFVKNAITLDGQSFIDDDGKIYMYWGTWGIYEGFGCGSGRLNPDMKSFAETRLIPNTEAEKFFEAPFVMKRRGTYYLMYSRESCHDSTYHVAYATSKKPLGPYKYEGVILRTNADGTVHGPGHHCVLQLGANPAKGSGATQKDGDTYYIVYHRHDNPHSNRGFHRQVCADRLEFGRDGKIKEVTPTHTGIGALAPSVVTEPDLARGAACTASSQYDEHFRASYATDHNNGTLWRARGDGLEWLTIDLGSERDIGTVETRWEYGTQFYQYLIETSTDGQAWQPYSDRRANRLAGSPMVDWGSGRGRYVRITHTGGEKSGFPAALWEVSVYGGRVAWAPQQWVGLHPLDYAGGGAWLNSCGMLGGSATLSAAASHVRVAGRDALVLPPGASVTYRSELLRGTETAVAAARVQDKWAQWPCHVEAGLLRVTAGDEPLTLADVRLFNYPLQAEEIEACVATPPTRHAAADRSKHGLFLHLTASDHAAGDTAWVIENRGTDGGAFEAEGPMATVTDTLGRRAFHFTGRESYRWNKPTPATMRDNAPYRLEAWILNPDMAPNECVLDLTSSHDELEKLMLTCGTEPRCGLLNHYGWYEDAGYHGLGKWGPEADEATRQALEGKWLHYVVTFDGRMETLTINGNVVSHKDIQLLLKPSTGGRLGLNHEGEWPFSGYVSDIKVWDEL